MDPRRRQLHSCDQCRKGKRGCDAPVCEDCPPLASEDVNFQDSRRSERKMASLVRTANDGRKSARLTGLPLSIQTTPEVGKENSQVLGVHIGVVMFLPLRVLVVPS